MNTVHFVAINDHHVKLREGRRREVETKKERKCLINEVNCSSIQASLPPLSTLLLPTPTAPPTPPTPTPASPSPTTQGRVHFLRLLLLRTLPLRDAILLQLPLR
jgi:hypothetical protein